METKKLKGILGTTSHTGGFFTLLCQAREKAHAEKKPFPLREIEEFILGIGQKERGELFDHCRSQRPIVLKVAFLENRTAVPLKIHHVSLPIAVFTPRAKQAETEALCTAAS